jgi:protein-S-isoprenylcysteine O-methyltransferase Ste14
VFYLAYFVKMLLLKRQNIKGNILGKGQKPQGKAAFETVMAVMLYLGVAAQVFSIIFDTLIWPLPVFPTMREDGLLVMLLGVAAFVLAITAMKNNWRAGYNDEQNTRLVTDGIYKFSRNPAFLGFDLLYLGCALAFPNILNIAFALLSVVLLHIQILGEEAFLSKTFGEEYKAYKFKTLRYFGTRRG